MTFRSPGFNQPASVGGSAGVWHRIAGTGAPSAGLGSDTDYALNDDSRVYYKSGGAWAVSSRMTAFAATLLAQGWTFATAGIAIAPTSGVTPGWAKTGFAAQSGQSFNFAGSSANSFAYLSIPKMASKVNAFFTVNALPVGGPINIGLGVIPGTDPWPTVTISTTGVVSINTGIGDLVKTMAGTLSAGDAVNLSMDPGAVLITTASGGHALKDQALFASPFVSQYNLTTYGNQLKIGGVGVLTAGHLIWSGIQGIEIVL